MRTLRCYAGLAFLAIAVALTPTVAWTRLAESGMVSLRSMLIAVGGNAGRLLLVKLGDRLTILDFNDADGREVRCDGVTDDSTGVSAAAALMNGNGATIHIPRTCRLLMGPAARLAGHTPVLDGVSFVGEGGRDSGNSQSLYGTRGGTVLLTDPGGPAFIARRNWALEKLIFYWPGQTEAAALANGGVPVAWPPLLTGPAGAGLPPGEVSSGKFLGNDVLNAWRVMDFGADVSGGLTVEYNRAFYLDAFVVLGLMPLESLIVGNDLTPNAWQSAPGMLAAGPTHTLINYAATHAWSVLAVGDGGPDVAGTLHVDGLKYNDNTLFGMAGGLQARRGTFNLLHASGNMFDGTPTAIAIGTGGKIEGASSLSGGVIFSYTFGQLNNPETALPVVSVAADSAPGSMLALDNIHLASAAGAFVDWESDGVGGAGGGAGGTLDITNVKADNTNGGTGGSPVPIVRFNSYGGALQIGGASRFGTGGANFPLGIDIPQPLYRLKVSDSIFISCEAEISLGGSFGTPNLITGNMSLNTHGPTAYAGAQGSTLSDYANGWDKPGPNWNTPVDGATSGLSFAFQGVLKALLKPDGSFVPSGSVNAPDINVAGGGGVVAARPQMPLAATPAVGAFNTVAAGGTYRKFGRDVTYSAQIYMTNVGTGTGLITISGFPFVQDPATYCVLAGKEVSTTSKAVTLTISPGTTMGTLSYADGTPVNATGLVAVVNGTCQTAG